MGSIHPSSLSGLAFAHLNLRRNPFGEVASGERGPLVVAEIEPWVERLSRPGFAVQFLGERGRGKTARLLALRARFPGTPYVLVREGERPAIPRAPLLFLDEAQRLAPSVRRRVFRRAGSLALGSHADHAAELRRAGLAVETVAVRGLTAPALAEIIRRRPDWKCEQILALRP